MKAYKPTKLYQRLNSIPIGLCLIIDGVLKILTLGLLRKQLYFTYVEWQMRRWLNNRRAWQCEAT